MDDYLNLCPGSNVKFKPAFASQEEYDRFVKEFREAVKPDLEKYARARMNSEIKAREHWVD